MMSSSLKTSKKYAPGQPAGEINPNTGFVVIDIDGQDYFAHDLAWIMHYGEPPKSPLIHVNGNLTDNRIINLRPSATV